MSSLSKPLVSIITPSFNQASYLEQTILSVLKQDYPYIEYIIIDGNSTDGSLDIIQRYADRISYWVSEPDEGQSHAINKGFARAKGEIVAWLNSDDLYLPGVISEAIKSLESNPDAGMAYANCLETDKESSILAWRRSRQLDLLDLLSFTIIPQPTVFLRRSVITSLGELDKSLHLLFDHQMWVRVAASFPILYHDRYWAAARMHSASKNSRCWADYGREALVLLQGLSKIPAVSLILTRHRNQIMAGVACFSGNYALMNGDSSNAIQEFTKAIRLYPAILRRIWKQLVLLAFKMVRPTHPGEEYYRLRRWYKSHVFRRELAVIQKYLQTLNVR